MRCTLALCSQILALLVRDLLYIRPLFASSWPAPVLLAFRVWRVNSRASEFRRTYSRLRIFLRVVIESGTIYTILNLALLISLRLNSPLVWYLRDIVS